MKVTAIATVLFGFAAIRLSAQDCKELQKATSAKLMRFLETNVPNDQNGECFTVAVRRLGDLQYEPGIDTLIRLLDFRRPANLREKAGIGSLKTRYPAEDALFSIGKSAEPSILNAIKGDITSLKTRENAVSVWMELHRDNSS